MFVQYVSIQRIVRTGSCLVASCCSVVRGQTSQARDQLVPAFHFSPFHLYPKCTLRPDQINVLLYELTQHPHLFLVKHTNKKVRT